MDKKPADGSVGHGGAGADDAEFEAWFNMMAINTDAETSAGGDESNSNLLERVSALEAKLVALERKKAGGGDDQCLSEDNSTCDPEKGKPVPWSFERDDTNACWIHCGLGLSAKPTNANYNVDSCCVRK